MGNTGKGFIGGHRRCDAIDLNSKIVLIKDNLIDPRNLNIFENLASVRSMEISDQVRVLEDKYHLYLGGHHGIVSSLTLTSDNTYIISCSHDKTIRIYYLWVR